METLLCHWEASKFFIVSSNVPTLLYYSHFPAIFLAMLIGVYVLIRDYYSLKSAILFFIFLMFSLWSFIDIIQWADNRSYVILFFWSLSILLEVLLYLASFYFIYVFISKKDLPVYLKLILCIFILPTIILLPTSRTITGIMIATGDATEGFMATYYTYFVEIFSAIAILIYSLFSYFGNNNRDEKKQIILITLGLLLFLLSFSWGNIMGSFMDNWEISQFGLFGMPIFVALLAYLIVKFQAFNIKMFGAQALVVGLVILIGSQFFFIDKENITNKILTGITFLLASGFGWTLISSVKKEMERKEELQIMADSLAVANDRLRRLDNSKSEFISIASHQLRTPLTAIKGFVSLILEGSYGKIEPKIKEVLGKIFISNERLIELVEDLLNISRIESGRMEYKIEKFKLEGLVNEIYDTFSLRAKKRGLKFEIIFPENPLPEIETDRNKMREIISNLIDNAIKYTERGWVRIKISYSDSDEIFRVSVIDTGIGTLKEDVPFLFSKFSRGTGASKINAGGTGLGLHVGRKMIEALGGKIWVESEGAGKGSTFFVEAPKNYSVKEEY